MAEDRSTGDAFLQEQLELLRKLNDRIAKIQDDVNHNVELLAQNRREVERWRREERIYRQRNPIDRRKTEPSSSDDSVRRAHRHARPHRKLSRPT